MRIVVLTGAGMSAESGIPTFRGAGGLWEGHRVEAVASPEGWAADRELVLQFYNERRRHIKKAQPNPGHLLLAEMEKQYDICIITQNIDDLHERAGSSDVIHLHGEIMKSRSSRFEELIYLQTEDIKIGDCCEKGYQLRPHIVWFGEMVPMIPTACEVIATADVVAVIGTSMLVYPAAGLVDYAPPGCPVYVINPEPPEHRQNWHIIAQPAGTGVATFFKHIADE
ncbi:MAG: NAD-dependent deacetylase [Sphingobacteriales bacterium BACL12 MAG-120813-bin55]|jgi:NAD-dependent deacetylase|nr:MAG: NAD-dependent deacetylase [Sphingobacteriales bacterium BACL12 MAG-120802-bin5]KRP13334.1 MAG: NAD-dependent deacetylase [Sphingobacteriales bacterium BACL12 MAG-120813-bin55]